jgi:CheY-like chemotaxis protein
MAAATPLPTQFILVIDDEAGDIQLVHRALSAIGLDAVLYGVQSSELARQFLERSRAFARMPRPDLVILDLHLPDASGYDVLRMIRGDERWRALTVAMLTSHADDVARRRCLALGADAFHEKPCDDDGYGSWALDLQRLLCERSARNLG